jgi:hypothetical protein
MNWQEKHELIELLAKAIVDAVIFPPTASESDRRRLICYMRAEAIALRGRHCRKDKNEKTK